MKFWRILLPASLVAVLFLSGCKDDKDDVYEYHSGTLSLVLPKYIEPGYSKTFCIDSLKKASRPDGGTIGYYFRDPVAKVIDTLVTKDGRTVKDKFTFTASDSLATLTISLNSFSDIYFGINATPSYTIVKPGIDGEGSLTGYIISDADKDKVFTDSRDGRKYLYTEIDGVQWMRQNLAWTGAGKPLSDCSAANDVFGRYYTWEEAQNACPKEDGWVLPSDADWKAIGRKYGSVDEVSGGDIKGIAGYLMEDIYFNRTKMWDFWPNVKIDNRLGLSVIPTGYATINEGVYSFESLYKYAAFWTSDTFDGCGVYRYIYQDKDYVFFGAADKREFGASVRCVRMVTSN